MEMENSILAQIAANAEYYRGFHMGDVLMYAESYFKLRSYNEIIVNIIIVAIAYALLFNMSISW